MMGAKKGTGLAALAAVGESGYLAPYEPPNFKAFNLAVAGINAEGGVDGWQLQVISRDTRSVPAEGKAMTEGLIGDDPDPAVNELVRNYAKRVGERVGEHANGKPPFVELERPPEYGI